VTSPEARRPAVVLAGTGELDPVGAGVVAPVEGDDDERAVAGDDDAGVVAATCEVATVGVSLALLLGWGGVRSRVMRLPHPESPRTPTTATAVSARRGVGTRSR
jgi:hypothetical protein